VFETQSRFRTRRLQQFRVELLADLPQKFRDRFSKAINNHYKLVPAAEFLRDPGTKGYPGIKRGLRGGIILGDQRKITDEVQESLVLVGIKLTKEAATRLEKLLEQQQHNVRDPQVASSPAEKTSQVHRGEPGPRVVQAASASLSSPSASPSVTLMTPGMAAPPPSSSSSSASNGGGDSPVSPPFSDTVSRCGGGGGGASPGASPSCSAPCSGTSAAAAAARWQGHRRPWDQHLVRSRLATAHAVQEQLRAQLAAARDQGLEFAAEQLGKARAQHSEKLAQLRAEHKHLELLMGASKRKLQAELQAEHKRAIDALKMQHNNAMLSAEQLREQLATARDQGLEFAAEKLAKARAQHSEKLTERQAEHKQAIDALNIKHNNAMLSAEQLRAQLLQKAREESASQATSASTVARQLRAELAAAQKEGAERLTGAWAQLKIARKESTEKLAKLQAEHRQASDALEVKYNDAMLRQKQLGAQLKMAQKESTGKLAQLRAEHRQAADALRLQHEAVLGQERSRAASTSRVLEEQLCTTRAQLEAAKEEELLSSLELQQLRTRLPQERTPPLGHGQLHKVQGQKIDRAAPVTKQEAPGAVSEDARATVAGASSSVSTGLVTVSGSRLFCTQRGSTPTPRPLPSLTQQRPQPQPPQQQPQALLPQAPRPQPFQAGQLLQCLACEQWMQVANSGDAIYCANIDCRTLVTPDDCRQISAWV
jgi:hypothetical protein